MKATVSSGVGHATPTEVEFESGDRVSEVRAKVAAIQGVVEESISLVKDGEVLDLDATMRRAGVKDGDVIKALPRDPVGGASMSAGILPQRMLQEEARLRRKRVSFRRTGPGTIEMQVHGRGKWRGSVWPVRIEAAPGYPQVRPQAFVLKQPQPWHPNVNKNGWICVNHLIDSWDPTQNFATIYDDIQFIMQSPNYKSQFPRPGQSPVAEAPRRLLRWPVLAGRR